jgi:hypothetical protein
MWLGTAPVARVPTVAAVLALGLAVVHLTAGRLELLPSRYRRGLLSAGGGASVAYVFVLILPEIGEEAAAVAESGVGFLAEQLVFLVALAGFVAFYGVEVAVSRRGTPAAGADAVYWAHVGVFAAYSAVVGYLLFHQERPGLSNLFFYALAMALHFAVTDYGLHRHHGEVFDTGGRALLAAGTLLGALVGGLTEVDELRLSLLFGFLAGAIVFTVVVEEIPEITEARFAAFVAGAALFSAVLLLA